MNIRILIIIGLLVALNGACDRSDIFNIPGPGGLSGAKEITSFTFLSGGVIGVIDEANSIISATLPFGMDLTSLAPEFITTGVSVWVGAMEQTSGTTTNNFSSSVVYTVHAEDSSTRDYTVTAVVPAGTAWSILNDAGTGSAFFGGDASHLTGRNVANGQSVTFDQNTYIEKFAVSFSAGFTLNDTGTPVEAPLRLNVRNSSGSIIYSFDVSVPISFAGGWVTWENLNIDIAGGTTLIFTFHVIDGTYTNEYSSSIVLDYTGNLYTSGMRYYNNDSLTDTEIESWTGTWIGHTDADLNFRVDGITY